MKNPVRFLLIFMLVFLTLFYGTFMAVQSHSDQEEIIKDLKEQIDILYIDIEFSNAYCDSLQQKLDLCKKINQLQIPEFEYINVLNAIVEVESNGNSNAYAPGEDAVGILQIRKCMVDDVNRILKRNNSSVRYNYTDRWNTNKSYEMFNIYCNHYNFTTAEHMARGWNGGPRGINKSSTLDYWEKVQGYLDS